MTPLPDDLENDVDDTLARVTRGLERTMKVLLAVSAAFVFLGALALLFAIGGGPARLLDRLIVAVIALLALGALDTQATRLARRHRPLLAPDPPWYRRFVLLSAFGLLGAAITLFGVAWYLP